MSLEKKLVEEFWNEASCGESLYLRGNSLKEAFEQQSRIRYSLEPEILEFIESENFNNKIVLEIGVGLGSDHQQLALRGAVLYGCDLTERAIEWTKRRFELMELKSDLRIADAENLPFRDKFFDIVYSWGVLHHSPDTPKAIKEVYRILNPKGKALIMIYQKRSLVGFMLWFRYGLLLGRPWIGLEKIYSRYLESPGTKAYTPGRAKELFADFTKCEITTTLTHADLLSSDAGQRHQGLLLTVARKIFPRKLVNKLFPNYGLFMMIRAEK